jgi:excisionase family DNA binding protein
MTEQSIERQLLEIKNHIAQQTTSQKEVLTLSESALYAGISKSYLYKLTSKRLIPFYRPETKLIFFKRTELDAWLLNKRSPSLSEMISSVPPKKQQS